MRKPRALLSLFPRPSVFRRQGTRRAQNGVAVRDPDDESPTSSRRAASELESGLRGSNAASAVLAVATGGSQDHATVTIQSANRPVAPGLAGGPGQRASAPHLDEQFAGAHTGEQPQLLEERDVLRDDAPAPNDDQDPIGSMLLPVPASAAEVSLAAIRDMANFYATEWLFIIKLAWPEVQQAVLAALGVCVIIGPGLCVPAVYFGSWLGLLSAVVFVGLATLLFSVLRRDMIPSSL